MKKGDISEMIQKLKAGREETPAVASITNASPRKMKSEVESIHRAKELEFPLEIASEKAPKKAVKKVVASVAVKKVKAEAAPPAKGKGSEDMKAKMAAIRAKKGKKE
jgi:hypothetical protein